MGFGRPQAYAIDQPVARAQALAEYNLALDVEATDSRLNESFLERKLTELERIDAWNAEPYWLTVARLAELAVVCTGNYADSGELQAVGDLLVNPRKILVHVRGHSEPVVKQRHMMLTQQFGHMASDKMGVIAWLKRETTLETVIPPLLVELYKKLFDSGYMSQAYMDSLDRRMTQIADTTAFVGSCHFSPDLDFIQYVHQASGPDREFILANLCGFTRDYFDDLGREAFQALYAPEYRSQFLAF